jgi:acyl-CoA thioester hydrolase
MMALKFFAIQKKIYLADTDVTGIAYYARHLEWLEMARVELIAKIYKPLTRMISEDGISFVPINVNLTYKAPAVFEDLITIKVRIKEVDKIRLLLNYEVTKKFNDQELLVAEADILMLCVNIARGSKPAKIPPYLFEVLEGWESKID